MSLDERSFSSDIGGTIASNGYLQINDLAYGVISMGAGNDHDVYSFVTQPGVTYSIFLTPSTFFGLSTNPLLNPLFGLRDSSGNLIDLSVSNGASQFYTFTSNFYRKYYIDVIGSTYLSSTGGYFVGLTSSIYDDFNGTSNVPLNLGYSQTGSLEQVGDIDVFSASIVAGRSYFFQISSPSISDLFIAAKDGYGRVLEFGGQGAGASYSFTASTTQSVYIGVSSNSFLQTGSYSLFAQERADITKVLSVGLIISDNIFFADGLSREVWGWDGNDVISVGAGNDFIFGGSGNDTISAGSGNDIISGDAGNDTIDGGDGIDIAIFAGNRASYATSKTSTGWTASSGVEGGDTLTSIERLKFSDQYLATDLGVNQSAGQTALLLGAVLGKDLMMSKQPLLGAVINLFDAGFNLQQLSGALMRLDIWGVLANGGSPGATNQQIATYLLTTVNKTTPDAAALAQAVSALDTETGANQGNFLWHLAESAANQAQVGLVGLSATGLPFMF